MTNSDRFPLYVLSTELQKGHIGKDQIEMTINLLRAGMWHFEKVCVSSSNSHFIALPVARWGSDDADFFNGFELRWICGAGYRLCHALLKASDSEHILDALLFTEEVCVFHSPNSNGFYADYANKPSVYLFLRGKNSW